MSIRFIVFFMAALAAFGQYRQPESNRRTNVNVDQFFGSWLRSEEAVTHGTLIEKPILKAGDANKPGPPAEVLEYHKQVSLGTLMGGNRAAPTKHPEQEILYVESGVGRLESGDLSWTLREGICVLIPPNMEHTFVNTSEEPLQMLLLTSLYDSSVSVRSDILVRDRRALPYAEPIGHWHFNAKLLFGPKDGLHPNEKVLLVWMQPMTVGAPHPHGPHWEEVWLKLPPGDAYALLGSEVRVQRPNEAFIVPPDGQTVHSTFNLTEKPMAWFYFGHYTQEVKYPDWVYEVPSVEPVRISSQE